MGTSATMETTSENARQSGAQGLMQSLSDLNRHLVSFTIASYVAGFVVANVHLGSLGIVTFDILRARYILVGLLFLAFLAAILMPLYGLIHFLAFLAAILMPLYGLIHVLRGHENRPSLGLLRDTLTFTFVRFSVIYFAVLALGNLSMTSRVGPLTFVGQLPPPPVDRWIVEGLPPILRSSWYLFVAIIAATAALLLLVFLIIVAINPKQSDGTRPPRSELVRSFLTPLLRRDIYLGLFKYLVLGLAFLIVLNGLGSLLLLVTTNGITSGAAQVTTLPEGWGRFVAASLVMYLIGATYLIFVKMTHHAPPVDLDHVRDPTRHFTGPMYLLSLIIAFVLPLYGLTVYPRLPQQVGGGRLLPVKVTGTDNVMQQYFAQPSVNRDVH